MLYGLLIAISIIFADESETEQSFQGFKPQPKYCAFEPYICKQESFNGMLLGRKASKIDGFRGQEVYIVIHATARYTRVKTGALFFKGIGKLAETGKEANEGNPDRISARYGGRAGEIVSSMSPTDQRDVAYDA